MSGRQIDGKLKLIDFAYSTLLDPVKEEVYAGSITTASQRVLESLLNLQIFKFTIMDDLESLFKAYLLWDWGVTLEFDPNESRTQQSLDFWAPKMIHSRWPAITDVKSAVAFLKSLLVKKPTNVYK